MFTYVLYDFFFKCGKRGGKFVCFYSPFTIMIIIIRIGRPDFFFFHDEIACSLSVVGRLFLAGFILQKYIKSRNLLERKKVECSS